MTIAGVLAFSGLCVLLALTPGPDTFLVLRYGLSDVRSALLAAVGCAIGSIAWAGLVAVGLAAVLEQSAEVFRVVKIAGGLYLIYLGVTAYLKTRKAAAAGEEAVVRRPGARPSLLTGLLSTLLNPKVGLFFLAVAPQFLPHHPTVGETMLLGAIDGVIAVLYLGCVAFLAARMMAWLKRPRVTSALERISAGVLALLGIGTIVSGAES